MRDKWGPLFAIAEVAGGHWPELLRKSMSMMMDRPDESIGIKLLEDIKEIFDASIFDKISSDDLVEKLKGMTESPWADWNKGRGRKGACRWRREARRKSHRACVWRDSAQNAQGLDFRRHTGRRVWARADYL